MTGTGTRPNVELYRERLAPVAVRMLDDEEWHSYSDVVHELMKAIPPSIAIRRAETLRKRKRTIADYRVIQRDADELIDIGRRDIARRFLDNRLNYEISKPYDRQAGNDGDRMVRMIGVPRWITPSTPAQIARQERVIKAERERNQVIRENEHLRDVIANLRIYLIGLGHEARANEIAPPDDED